MDGVVLDMRMGSGNGGVRLIRRFHEDYVVATDGPATVIDTSARRPRWMRPSLFRMTVVRRAVQDGQAHSLF